MAELRVWTFRRRPRFPLGQMVVVSLVLSFHLALRSDAALTSGAYQTPSNAPAREWGDRVPGKSRTVPQFATVRLDLNSTPPSLTADITNAVLEGGAPFALTIRSSSGVRLTNGTYRFQGDFLREIYPSGTQYFFDYRFSVSTNGEVLWDGTDYWSGGHLWFVTFSNIALVQVPWLDITPVAPASLQIVWSTNFASHILESADSLLAPSWSTVTNAPTIAGDRFSVTLDGDISRRFYRLRKP